MMCEQINITTNFLKSIDDIRKRQISAKVITRTKQSLLDYLAVTCAGAAFQKEKIKKYFSFSQPETGKFKAIGTRKNLALKEAVFLNGLNAHALDFDDGTNSGIIHLGSPIFSVLIPLSQQYEIKIDDMLKAAIIGYETSYTMAVSIQPGHKQEVTTLPEPVGYWGRRLRLAICLGFQRKRDFRHFQQLV